MTTDEDVKRAMETPEERGLRYAKEAEARMAAAREAASRTLRESWWKRHLTPAQRYLIVGITIVVVAAVIGAILTH